MDRRDLQWESLREDLKRDKKKTKFRGEEGTSIWISSKIVANKPFPASTEGNLVSTQASFDKKISFKKVYRKEINVDAINWWRVALTGVGLKTFVPKPTLTYLT